ncbi:MAG: PAS domain-containing methyl-accepting chemotaxis protein [Gammaproteobacteria bacterium]|nr:PAS domain-containing methyl-accepting chemotaxis protein [Gammaproteobacteria bacterium]
MIFNKHLHSQLSSLQEALAASNAVIEAIKASMACIEFSPDGRITEVNQLFLDAVGYPRDRVLGAHHRMFCDPQYVNSPAYTAFWNSLAEGRFHSGSFARRNASGERLWLEATYFPVRDARGQVDRVIKIAANVTQKHSQLEEQTAIFSALDRSMAVISFTPDGEILDANRNFLDTMGYRLEEIRGRHHRMLCDPIFYQENPQFWAQLASGQFISDKFRRLDARGQEIWLEASYNPILDDEGKTVKVIKFATDVTQSVQTAEKIRDASAVAYSMAQQTAENARRGSSSLQASVQTSAEIRQLIDEAKQVIDKLNAQSKNIETIVATISGVADQTNLLALNAAIEAARAGEQGRGFAVVADEVRSLAARTSTATAEIAEVIHGNLRHTSDIVARIEHVSEVAETGRQQVISAEKLVAEIHDGSIHVVELVSSIPSE